MLKSIESSIINLEVFKIMLLKYEKNNVRLNNIESNIE